jgi:2-C-methyl-D-erythritol 4-phosphate cytidylyltransferase
MVKDDIDFVAVHDAVRCCLTEQWVNDVFAKANQTGPRCSQVRLSQIKKVKTTDNADR